MIVHDLGSFEILATWNSSDGLYAKIAQLIIKGSYAVIECGINTVSFTIRQCKKIKKKRSEDVDIISSIYGF